MPTQPFNHTNGNELKPEVTLLFAGRRRVTRRFTLGNQDNIADAIFKAYGEADPGEATSCHVGYANLKLVSQAVVPNDKGPSVLVQVFETLTSVLVAEGESVLGRDVNDILVAKVSYIGLPGATGGLSVGAAFTVGGVICVVSELEIQENSAFKRVTYVARQVGTGGSGAGEKQVGGDEIEVDANARHTLVRRFTQSAAAPYVAGVIGSTITVGGISYVLSSETKTETASTRSIVRTYLEATATWTPVGPDKVDRDINGLMRVRINLVAKAGTAEPDLTVGGSEYVVDGSTLYLARTSNAESDEAVSRLTVEYLEPGELTSSTNYSDNGALETRSVSWFYSVPATPAGFVLVGTQETNVVGYPVLQYSFVRGVGEISRSTQGREDGTVITVRALSAPGGGNPVTTPAGYVITEATPTEADGYRNWVVQYAKGNDVIDFDLNGLKRRTMTTVYTAGATPPTIVVGVSTHPTDATLRLAQLRDVGNDANITRTAVYLQPGTVSIRTQAMENGLKKVTINSFFTKTSPTGDVIDERNENENGYPVWSVTAVQAADGTSVVGVDGAPKLARTKEALVDFRNPGVIDVVEYEFPFTDGNPDGEGIELIQSPPTVFKVQAKVFTYFQNSGLINPEADYAEDDAEALWNPSSWPAINARYTPFTGTQVRLSDGYPNYRMADISEDPKTVEAQVAVDGLAFTRPVVFGNICEGDLDNDFIHTVTLSGGPENPLTRRYVLDVDIVEEFQRANGTPIHRKTIVVATIIPAQLPE